MSKDLNELAKKIEEAVKAAGVTNEMYEKAAKMLTLDLMVVEALVNLPEMKGKIDNRSVNFSDLGLTQRLELANAIRMRADSAKAQQH